MSLLSLYLRMPGGKRTGHPMQLPNVARGGATSSTQWAFGADATAYLPDGTTWPVPADVPALLWGTSSTSLNLDMTAYVLFLLPSNGQLYAIAQDAWRALYAAQDVCRVAWVDAHYDLRPGPRPNLQPLVILHWASAPFAGQQLGTQQQPVLPYPDPTVSPTWNAMLYGPGVAQNRVIVPRMVQADYNAAATWVWVLTATGALYSVNVDGSNPVLAPFPRLLTPTAALGAVLTTLVHSIANEAGDTGYIEQYETVGGVLQCWGEFKVQYDAGAWRKWGVIEGGVFLGGTDYIIAQWPNTPLHSFHFDYNLCRSVARAAMGVVWAGGAVGTQFDPDHTTPVTPDYYWATYPDYQGGSFFSNTLALRIRQNTAMGTTGVARETTLDMHGAPDAISSGAANGILPIRVGGGGIYADGFTYMEPVVFGVRGMAGGFLEQASVGEPDGQLGIQFPADLGTSAFHAASAVGRTASVWIADQDLYYAAAADRSDHVLLLAGVIFTGDVVALLTRTGGADPRLGTDTTITLVCVHGQGDQVQNDTITIPVVAGVPTGASIQRGAQWPFPTDTYWHAGTDGTGATDSAALSGAYIGPLT